MKVFRRHRGRSASVSPLDWPLAADAWAASPSEDVVRTEQWRDLGAGLAEATAAVLENRHAAGVATPADDDGAAAIDAYRSVARGQAGAAVDAAVAFERYLATAGRLAVSLRELAAGVDPGSTERGRAMSMLAAFDRVRAVDDPIAERAA